MKNTKKKNTAPIRYSPKSVAARNDKVACRYPIKYLQAGDP